MIQNLVDKDNFIVKESTIQNFIIWIILISLSIAIYLIKPLFLLNENQILYFFSAAAQVIAAIYGLIITGYIFLRNTLDTKADKDDSFEEIVQLLKREYFGYITGISFVTILSISLCLLVIADVSSNDRGLSILINVSGATIMIELILIISFVINILNPKSIEIASNKLKEITAVDSTGEKGSLEDFLKYYNSIEYILEKYGTEFSYYQNEENNFDGRRKRRIAKTKLVYILSNAEKIDEDLKNNLIKLISFRNSLIHGSELFVSKEEVEVAKTILNELEQSLTIGQTNPVY